jgi:hypothetical protein
VAAAAGGYAEGNKANEEVQRAADGKSAPGQNFEGLGVHDCQGLAGRFVSGFVGCFFQFPFDNRSPTPAYPYS